MLDTNICIYTIKRSSEKVLKKLKTLKAGDVCISSITLSELSYGVEKSQHSHKNKNALMQFLSSLEILPYDVNASLEYGDIRALLEKKRMPIGALDLMIAAHARSLKLSLVTNNKKEFLRVPKLKIENWV